MKCGFCGSELPEHSNFCGNCGKTVASVDHTVQKGSKKQIIVLVLTLVICLLVGVVVLVTAAEKSMDKAMEKSRQETAESVLKALEESAVPAIPYTSSVLGKDVEGLKRSKGARFIGPSDKWTNILEEDCGLTNIEGLDRYYDLDLDECYVVKDGKVAAKSGYTRGGCVVNEVVPEEALTVEPAEYEVPNTDWKAYVWKLTNGYLSVVVKEVGGVEFYNQYVVSVTVAQEQYLSFPSRKQKTDKTEKETEDQAIWQERDEEDPTIILEDADALHWEDRTANENILLVPVGQMSCADLNQDGTDEKICVFIYDDPTDQLQYIAVSIDEVRYQIEALGPISMLKEEYAICDLDETDSQLEIVVMMGRPSGGYSAFYSYHREGIRELNELYGFVGETEGNIRIKGNGQVQTVQFRQCMQTSLYDATYIRMADGLELKYEEFYTLSERMRGWNGGTDQGIVLWPSTDVICYMDEQCTDARVLESGTRIQLTETHFDDERETEIHKFLREDTGEIVYLKIVGSDIELENGTTSLATEILENLFIAG